MKAPMKSPLVGRWWLWREDGNLLQGEYSLGDAGDGPEPDWVYTEDVDPHWIDEPVTLLAERFTLCEWSAGMYRRETRRRTIEPTHWENE
jgi:hypothetical protein